jgi:alkanesulfonate monooxygenase
MSVASKSTPPSGRQIHLGYMYWANGTHPAGWRFPGAQYDRAFDAEYIVQLAQLAEDAKFDFFFFGDRLATGVEYEHTNTSVLARIEPFTTASYLATRTKKIGLVVTANPTYYEPFNLARLMSSLDHITRGRASWNIVTGADGRAAFNYGRPEHGDATARYDRADEFVQIVRGLWDSWEDGAFVHDVETGRFVDGSKIHPLNHKGKTFSVRGPLNIARSPQGQPVILHAGTSDRSRNLGALEADVIFAGASTIDMGKAYSTDIRARAQSHGRDPSQVFIMPGLTPIVGETIEEARHIYDTLNSLLVLDEDIRFGGLKHSDWILQDNQEPVRREDYGLGVRNIGALSQRIGVDLTSLDLDDRLSAEDALRLNPAGKHILATVRARTGREIAGRNPIRIRDLLYSHIVGGHFIVGDPTGIADYIQSWFDQGASDGFNIQSAYLFDQLIKFKDLVVPVLQVRGLFRIDYDGATLRDHLGLSRPQNRLIA